MIGPLATIANPTSIPRIELAGARGFREGGMSGMFDAMLDEASSNGEAAVGAAAGYLRGSTREYADEAVGALGELLGEDHEVMQERARGFLDRASENAPVSSGVGSMVGGALTDPTLPFTGGMGRFGRVVLGGIQGAVEGALSARGASESDNPDELNETTAIGSVAGAVPGMLLGGIGRSARLVEDARVPRAIQSVEEARRSATNTPTGSFGTFSGDYTPSNAASDARRRIGAHRVRSLGGNDAAVSNIDMTFQGGLPGFADEVRAIQREGLPMGQVFGDTTRSNPIQIRRQMDIEGPRVSNALRRADEFDVSMNSTPGFGRNEILGEVSSRLQSGSQSPSLSSGVPRRVAAGRLNQELEGSVPQRMSLEEMHGLQRQLMDDAWQDRMAPPDVQAGGWADATAGRAIRNMSDRRIADIDEQLGQAIGPELMNSRRRFQALAFANRLRSGNEGQLPGLGYLDVQAFRNLGQGNPVGAMRAGAAAQGMRAGRGGRGHAVAAQTLEALEAMRGSGVQDLGALAENAVPGTVIATGRNIAEAQNDVQSMEPVDNDVNPYEGLDDMDDIDPYEGLE